MSPDAEDRSLYQQIARNALAATGAHIVALVARDPATGDRRILAWAGQAETLRRALEAIHRVMPAFDPLRLRIQAPLNPVLDALYREGQARQVPFREAAEGSLEPLLMDVAERFLSLRLSYLCPLTLDGEVLGVLSFHSAEPPDERERRVCEAFAAQAALTLENARLTAEARAQEAVRADQAEEITRVLAAVGAAPDLLAALEALVRGAVRLVPSSHGLARTFDPDTGCRDHELVLYPDGSLLHRPEVGLLSSQSFGDILRRGSGPVIVRDYQANDPAVPPGYYDAAGVRADGTRAALHMPIESGGRVIGNLSLNHPEPGRFGPRAVAVLGALTSLAGAAIDRARLDARRRAAETGAAKLEGALLVARTVAHEINNALAPVTGYAELMGLRPAVKADPLLARYAALIGTAAQDAAAKVQRLQSLVRLEETPSHPGDALPVLDMDASTTSRPAQSPPR